MAGSLTRAGRDYLAQRPREGRTFSCSDPAWDGGMPPRGSWRRPGGPQPRRPAPLRRDRVDPAPIGAGYDDSCGEHRRHVGGRRPTSNCRTKPLCIGYVQESEGWMTRRQPWCWVEALETPRCAGCARVVLATPPGGVEASRSRPSGGEGWGAGASHTRGGASRGQSLSNTAETVPSSGAVTSRAARPPRSFRDGVCPHVRRSRGRAGGRMGQLPRPWLGSAGAADCADAPSLRCQGHCLHCRLRPLRPP